MLAFRGTFPIVLQSFYDLDAVSFSVGINVFLLALDGGAVGLFI